jgi:hypothetical protein
MGDLLVIMALIDIGYTNWLSKKLWEKGNQLYADDENENEIKRIAFQISRKHEIVIKKRTYKNIPVFLLYQCKNELPIIPTKYYYDTLDPIESEGFYLSDMISSFKSNNDLNIPFSYQR